MERKKFEYETLKVLPELYFDKLNEFGLLGWEMVFLIVINEVHKSVITQQSENKTLFYITFKREKI